MRGRAAWSLALIGVLALLAAGCGGGEEVAATAETVGGPVPTQTESSGSESTATETGGGTETQGDETDSTESETGNAETDTEDSETETGETESGTGTGGGGGGAASGDAQAGQAIWSANGCGGCHTLAAANATGNVGPNLDEEKPEHDLVVDRVTNGKGVMPSFKASLSDEDIQNVAAYVVESTSGG
ncbi:MAG: cytochrome c [Actinobacteria bacterium]|nr:cytochrome c [Actinomycetota bacterium]